MARKSGKKGKKPAGGKSFFTKVITAAILISLVVAGGSVYFFLRASRAPNTRLMPEAEPYLYIPTGSTYKDVLQLLVQKHLLLNTETFDWLAKQKNYPRHIHPGKYRLREGMSNTELIHLLRSGKQEEVKLSVNNLRTKSDLIKMVCSKLEADSVELRKILEDDHFLAEHGFHSDNVNALFIENSYSFLWNTSAEKFFLRMLREYHQFWSKERLAKAEKQGISAIQAIILASIVEKESNYLPERPRIASVYLNRLRKNMKLQADPTVIFACGDFTISRVLEKHLQKDSPYNTYKYEGLPPGPICIPSQDAIRAVLQAESTNYLYFCAKEDFSGKHNFASGAAQHQANAGKYRKALNRKKIFK